MRNQIANLYLAVSAPVTATRDALAENVQSVRETASLLYNTMIDNMEYGEERLKDIVEKGAREEEEETTEKTEEDNIDLTGTENERALKGAYRSLMILATPEADTDNYFDRTKTHIKTLIADQLERAIE